MTYTTISCRHPSPSTDRGKCAYKRGARAYEAGVDHWYDRQMNSKTPMRSGTGPTATIAGAGRLHGHHKPFQPRVHNSLRQCTARSHNNVYATCTSAPARRRLVIQGPEQAPMSLFFFVLMGDLHSGFPPQDPKHLKRWARPHLQLRAAAHSAGCIPTPPTEL